MSNVGEAAKGILTKALAENIFIEKNLCFMNEGNKHSYNIFKLDIANVLTAAQDNPAIQTTTQRGAINRILTHVQSTNGFDPSDYHAYWLEFQPDGKFLWETLPTNIKFALEELFLGQAAEATEALLTIGDTDNGDAMDGLIPQLRNTGLTALNGTAVSATQTTANTAIAFRAHDAGTNDTLGVALTSQNVFSKFEILLKNQSKSMRKRANRKFMIGSATMDLLGEAQRLELTNKGVNITEAGVMRYAGFEIIENSSFPENDIMFCSMSGDMNSDAIQLGTSSSEDRNNVQVERVSAFSRSYGMVLQFAIDIYLVRPEEIVYYTDQTVSAI